MRSFSLLYLFIYNIGTLPSPRSPIKFIPDRVKIPTFDLKIFLHRPQKIPIFSSENFFRVPNFSPTAPLFTSEQGLKFSQKIFTIPTGGRQKPAGYPPTPPPSPSQIFQTKVVFPCETAPYNPSFALLPHNGEIAFHRSATSARTRMDKSSNLLPTLPSLTIHHNRPEVAIRPPTTATPVLRPVATIESAPPEGRTTAQSRKLRHFVLAAHSPTQRVKSSGKRLREGAGISLKNLRNTNLPRGDNPNKKCCSTLPGSHFRGSPYN